LSIGLFDYATEKQNVVFEKVGNQLNKWHTAHIDLNPTGRSKVGFFRVHTFFYKITIL